MSKKIVIDKEKVYEILNSQSINMNEQLFHIKNLVKNATEIDTDQSIEKRCEQTFLNKFGNKISAGESWVVRYAIDCATEQDLISKAREGEFAQWCSVNGWYFYSKDNIWRKHGNGGFEYKTTEELFNQFTNK